MDFTKLPVEVFQTILSCLPYKELLKASLVCREWKRATETLIILKGMLAIDHSAVAQHKLDALGNVTRSYQSVVIRNLKPNKKRDVLAKLQPVLEVCARKITPKSVELDQFSGDHAYLFCGHYRDWINGGVESLEVHCGMMQAAYPKEQGVGSQKELTLEFPNLKHLAWDTWFRTNSKSLTVDGPELETVLLSGQATNVKIVNCNKLKRIDFKTSKSLPLTDTFAGNLSNLTWLKLNNHSATYDFSFMDQMKYLQWVDLQIYRSSFASAMNALAQCSDLLGLKLTLFDSEYSNTSILCAESIIDLNRFLGSASQMQKLELGGVFLRVSDQEVKATKLVQLKLKDVKLSGSLRMIAPKLATLTVPAEVMANLHLQENSCLKQLYIFTKEKCEFKHAFESGVYPFVKLHSTVKELYVINQIRYRYTYEDPGRYSDNMELMDVEKLELRGFSVAIDFFRKLTTWDSLKHLVLSDCLVDCAGDVPLQHLPRLESLTVDRGLASNIENSFHTFPIRVRGSEIIRDMSGYFRNSCSSSSITIAPPFDLERYYTDEHLQLRNVGKFEIDPQTLINGYHTSTMPGFVQPIGLQYWH